MAMDSIFGKIDSEIISIRDMQILFLFSGTDRKQRQYICYATTGVQITR